MTRWIEMMTLILQTQKIPIMLTILRNWNGVDLNALNLMATAWKNNKRKTKISCFLYQSTNFLKLVKYKQHFHVHLSLLCKKRVELFHLKKLIWCSLKKAVEYLADTVSDRKTFWAVICYKFLYTLSVGVHKILL